ncbi:MAG: type II toxin-antitoxin system PemK/MazF family toxin [Actinomycetia bacterium]|nr:type II toxin-antitoxin system PemK/MazF family toxin [Actinomycetes bacterium]
MQFPKPVGTRPCVVLTSNPLIARLGAVTVAEVTGTAGPPSTHIDVDADARLTGRDRYWVNTTELHTIPKGKLRRHRGRLDPVELRRVSTAVRVSLDLD